MNNIIRKRKSIRKYEDAPLSAATINMIMAQLTTLVPLYSSIGYSIETTPKTKGLFNVKAPHYFLFTSEKKDGYLENIGFIGQQLDLFLSEAGIGTCWLGAAKPTEKQATTLPYVIGMSFGNAAEPLYRDTSEFKRKPLSAVSEGNDERLEAARLAPSGLNAQNWYFVAYNGNIHCYRKKTVLGFLNRMACIDMGIALYHIAAESHHFNFITDTNAPVRKGYIYMGTVGGLSADSLA